MTSGVEHRPAHDRWRPSPFIVGSLGVHCAAGVTALAAPHTLPWALAAVALNEAALIGAGFTPRSSLLGPNVTRLPKSSARRGEVALTFDDGPNPDVTPRMLELLEAHGSRGTFFCIAERAAEHPELVREMLRRGHGVENHSLRHPPTFALRSLSGFREDLCAAQAILARICGASPRFFRAPYGFRNPLLDPVLHELRMRLVSWTRRGFDAREGDPAVVTRRLLRGLAAGDILLLHDGHSAPAPSGAPVALEVLPRVLDALAARGLRSVPVHEALAP